MERRLAAILAADVVGYSRLVRADEEGTLATLKAIRLELIDPKIAEHQGRIVKLMGDGMLAEFNSVTGAVRMAADVQRAIVERNSELPEDRRIVFRFGVNLGDVVIDGDDIQGDGVNLAARLEGLAEPGGICISGAVYDQIRDRVDLAFEDLGDRQVKNIDRPIKVWGWLPGRTPTVDAPAQTRPVSAPNKPSIAVLPFDNMSTDTELDHFCTGLSESLITDLSKSKLLTVAARNASFAHAGKGIDVIAVARALNVAFLVEGSVQAMGQRLRVNIQLIDGLNGQHLWAERYDFSDADLFAAQDHVVADAVVEIDAAMDMGDMARRRREMAGSPEAYAVYQRAYSQTVEGTQGSIQQARRHWNKLVTIGANPGLGLGGLASCLLMDVRNGWAAEPEAATAEGLRLLDEALVNEPDFPFLHALRCGFLLLSDRLDAALDAGKVAVDLDPTYTNSIGYYAVSLSAAGEYSAASRNFQSYFRIMPNPTSNTRMRYAEHLVPIRLKQVLRPVVEGRRRAGGM